MEVIPEAVDMYQIPLGDVLAAIQRRNIHATAGTLESYTSEKNLVTLAQFHDPLDVGEVIVRSTLKGTLIRVKDLAVVRDDFEEEKIISRINGKSAISLLVVKSESADIIRTVNAVTELIERESQHLPEAVEILYSNDTSRYVHNRFRVVTTNGLLGLILVTIMLTFFLNLRTAFWVAMGLPFTLLGVIFLLPRFDTYIDSVSLSSMILVLGIIVDDAIIISENIYRRREKGDPPLVAAVEGIREVFRPVLTTIFTTFVAFAPMFFMTGTFGKFIFVIPLVISLALFVSLIEVVVALPAHLVKGLHRHAEGGMSSRRHRWFDLVRVRYHGIMPRVLRFRYVFVLLSFFVLAISLWYAGNFMKFILFPSNMAEQFFIGIELPQGSSLQNTSDRVKEIEDVIANLPEGELDSFVSRIGTKFMSAAGENHAVMSVNLTPSAKRSRIADEIVEDLRQKTNKLTGFTKILYEINTGGPPVGKPVTIRVVGSDDPMRTRLGDEVEAYLTTIEGVKDIDRDDIAGKDQVEVQVDYDTLSRLGLTVADIAQNLRMAYDGEVVTSVRYGEEDVDFRVILEEKARKQLDGLSELLIPNRQGELVKLKAVIGFKTGPGPSEYRHFDGERTVTITADVIQEITTPLMATDKVLAHFNLDKDWPGMRFVIGGESQETEESMASLYSTFAIAVLGIYFLLILLFNSITQPILVMLAIPFGIIGVIIAFALHGEPISFVAMLGVIGLVGVVVNDSLVMVNHLNDVRKQSPSGDIVALIAEGCADRLRAVLMTTLTTVVGLVPLAYGLGGTDAFMAPMALALGYGLLFATPLTLVLVPCLYMIFHDIGRIFSRGGRDDEADT